MQKRDVQELKNRLEEVISLAQASEQQHADAIARVHPQLRCSAQNLLHYLGLRSTDIRRLQEQLSALGLSSLGRSESHVLPSLQAVHQHVAQLLQQESNRRMLATTKAFSALKSLLKPHTEALLGPLPAGQSGSIMVTMHADLADDVPMVKALLQAGMSCARINCAHDEASTWKKLAQTIRQASAESGIGCPIFMDLAGPKLRTGPLKEVPKLLQLKPRLDRSGKLAEAASLWLVAEGSAPPEGADAVLPVAREWLKALEPGQKIKFKDARGRKRSMSIQELQKNCARAHILKNAYIRSGTRLYQGSRKKKTSNSTLVSRLPQEEVELRLHKGDTLLLHARNIPGEPATADAEGSLLEPAHIACSLPKVLADVKAGERILLNDGKIEGVVTEAGSEQLLITITYAKDGGSRLRANKSINFPDSSLQLHGLTEKDRQDLKTLIQLADVVNVSFVENPEDLQALFRELERLQAPPLGILLKVETKRAFEHLPQLLLTLMQHYPVGIMIARGDLAVEVGWNRLAEVQEEILWLCEAAHLPVVWATQVLESLAKKGRPSRAEITDAAMAQRAECVMLNKGPHILEAIISLRNIMKRMQGHQSKKFATLRSLRLASLK